MHVSLSLWSIDQARVAEEIERFDPLVDSFHVDIVDGCFADNLLFAPLTIQTLRTLTDKPITAHLMMTHPARWVSRMVDAGADLLAVHPSAADDLAETLGVIRRAGASAGVAVALDEPEQPVLDNLDGITQVLVMATAIGVKGQPFNRAALERIRRFAAQRRAATTPWLFVDGGIRWSSVPEIANAGADGVVAGSIVAMAEDPSESVNRIKSMSAQREIICATAHLL